MSADRKSCPPTPFDINRLRWPDSLSRQELFLLFRPRRSFYSCAPIGIRCHKPRSHLEIEDFTLFLIGHSGNRPQRLRERSRKSECRRGYRALRRFRRRAGEEAAGGRAVAGGAQSFPRRRALKQFSIYRECACTIGRERFQT